MYMCSMFDIALLRCCGPNLQLLKVVINSVDDVKSTITASLMKGCCVIVFDSQRLICCSHAPVRNCIQEAAKPFRASVAACARAMIMLSCKTGRSLRLWSNLLQLREGCSCNGCKFRPAEAISRCVLQPSALDSNATRQLRTTINLRKPHHCTDANPCSP